jgi:hypothetical protein
MSGLSALPRLSKFGDGRPSPGLGFVKLDFSLGMKRGFAVTRRNSGEPQAKILSANEAKSNALRTLPLTSSLSRL